MTSTLSAKEICEKLDNTSRALICVVAESEGGFSHPPTPQTRLAVLALLDCHAVKVEEGYRLVATTLGKELAEVCSDSAFMVWQELSVELRDALARLSNSMRWIPDCVHTQAFNALCERKLATSGQRGGVLDGYQICPWGLRVWLTGKLTVLS